MAKLKITHTTSQTSVNYPAPQVDRFINPTVINGNHIGGVGGVTTQTGSQIKPNVFITGGSATTGSILAQKGIHKFRVTDGTRTGVCELVNNTTLAAGQMHLWANVCIIPSASMAAANVVGGATSATVSWSTTPIGPVATPRVGDYLQGFSSANITGVFGARVASVVSATSVTVTTTGNVAAQTVLANTMTLVSRIDNKFIRDFISDGYSDTTSGTIDYYTNGFNPTKFRYVLGGNAISASATITSGFARVISG
jgi:hypothetical protein